MAVENCAKVKLLQRRAVLRQKIIFINMEIGGRDAEFSQSREFWFWLTF